MKKQHLTWLSCLFLSCLATILLSSEFAPQAVPQTRSPLATHPTEVRGVWLTNVASSVFYEPWGIDRVFAQLSQMHFNTVYPVVWNRGQTFYPSAVGKTATGWTQEPWLSVLHPGQDVLAQMVQLGKEQHLRVIPWFEYGFMAPIDSTLVQQHPSWLTLRKGGLRTIDADPQEDLPETIVWLNPLHPQVQDFILALIREVVSHYDVAGIQLDDHFSLPVKFGYDPYTVSLYQKEHHGKKPPDNSKDAEWMRWRANKLSAFMGRVFKTVKTANPHCQISLSPNPQGFAYQAYLQDWQTWVDRGWIEELVLQAYRQDLKRFQAELIQPAVQAAKRHIPVTIGIHTGSWQNPVSFRQIQKQVQAVRSGKFAGVSFFYWESLKTNLASDTPEAHDGFKKLFTAS
ncbi:MAG TPA: family 10 glycosylhydrolase [Trichocoleus sp.]